MQVQPDPLPSPSPPTPSLQIFPEDPCNSYPCSSVYNPLQNPTSTSGFTLFCCLWFPANLIQYTLVYGGMAVFLLLGVFWASWSMAVWCVFYILKSPWPLLLQKFFFCSIHLSFSFWCTNYSCITSFDIIPHFLINLFCFVIIINIFLFTLVWKVSVVLSLSLLIFFPWLSQIYWWNHAGILHCSYSIFDFYYFF